MKTTMGMAWIAGVGALALGLSAAAQGPAGGSGASGMFNRGSGTTQAPEAPRVAGPNLSELVALRLAQLEEDLGLTPAQQVAWARFRERVQAMLDDRRRSLQTAAREATAPERLDALADVARNRLAAAEEIADAGKSLYKQLTPVQRGVADRRLGLPLATLIGQDAGADLPSRALPPRGAPPKSPP